MEDVYVVKSLHSPLLGRPAITKLGLVTRVDGVSIHTLQERYPKLFSGQGLLQMPYTIELSPGAVPFSLKTPRRMERMGVMSWVEERTHRVVCRHCRGAHKVW